RSSSRSGVLQRCRWSAGTATFAPRLGWRGSQSFVSCGVIGGSSGQVEEQVLEPDGLFAKRGDEYIEFPADAGARGRVRDGVVEGYPEFLVLLADGGEE